MANNVKEQKCANCGSAMRFDPEKALLVCDHCGSTNEIGSDELEGDDILKESTDLEGDESNGIGIGGFDFNSLNEKVRVESAEELPVYECVSCGAEVIARPEEFALTCPYCTNNIVLTDKVSGKLRPNKVIPFRINSKELPESVRNYYKGKVLLPKGFFENSKMQKVTGVYVPFWIFRGNINGSMNFDGQKDRSYRKGDYIITETKHYDVSREVSMDFKNLPVDASLRVDDALMDSLEPFDMEEAKPFDIRYLAGFTADRFDVESEDIAKRAEQRMQGTAEDHVTSEAGKQYDKLILKSSELRADLDADYTLMPCYLFDVSHEGKDYEFAVNGQTGKVVGKLPISKTVMKQRYWKRVLFASTAVILISVIMYFAGL